MLKKFWFVWLIGAVGAGAVGWMVINHVKSPKVDPQEEVRQP